MGIKGIGPVLMFCTMMMSGVYFNNLNRQDWYDRSTGDTRFPTQSLATSG